MDNLKILKDLLLENGYLEELEVLEDRIKVKIIDKEEKDGKVVNVVNYEFFVLTDESKLLEKWLEFVVKWDDYYEVSKVIEYKDWKKINETKKIPRLYQVWSKLSGYSIDDLRKFKVEGISWRVEKVEDVFEIKQWNQTPKKEFVYNKKEWYIRFLNLLIKKLILRKKIIIL